MNRRQKAHRWGLVAEHYCAWWLRCKGYGVLGVRVRTVAGEIDIVACKRDTLIVVEVKARVHHDAALTSVDATKRARLVRAALALQTDAKIAGRRGGCFPNMRFDVMTVTPWGWPRHMTDAWRADR